MTCTCGDNCQCSNEGARYYHPQFFMSKYEIEQEIEQLKHILQNNPNERDIVIAAGFALKAIKSIVYGSISSSELLEDIMSLEPTQINTNSITIDNTVFNTVDLKCCYCGRNCHTPHTNCIWDEDNDF